VRDIAILLHVNPATVRRWIQKGQLSAKFFGGRAGYRIERAHLKEFLGRPAVRRNRKNGDRELIATPGTRGEAEP
jgi:excisionase family DNA binding protein